MCTLLTDKPLSRISIPKEYCLDGSCFPWNMGLIRLTEQMSISQLYSVLDNQYGTGGKAPLHIFLLFPKREPEKLSLYASRMRVGIETDTLAEGLYNVRITLRKRHASGYLITRGNIWNLLIQPVESSASAQQVTATWLKNMYPVLSPAYVESEQMLGVLDSFNQVEEEHELQISDYFLRSREGSTSKTWPKGEPYVRRDLEERIGPDFLLDAISFSFKIGETSFETRICRDGHLVLYEGGKTCFSDLQRLVIQPVSSMAARNRTRFQDRGRKMIEGEAVVSPLKMDPGRRLGKRDLDNLRLRLCRNFSAAVVHGGNPWLLTSIIDRADGGYYDVYGYEDEISIVPFSRSSPDSLARLYSLILELFPLSKIQE